MIEREASAIEPGATDAVVAERPRRTQRSGAPRLFARLGLAIVHPRWALTVAVDRAYAGRSGSDLIAAIVLLLAATQLRGLATAVWLGSSIDLGLGMRAAIRVLTGTLTVDLGLLVLGALVVFGPAVLARKLSGALSRGLTLPRQRARFRSAHDIIVFSPRPCAEVRM